jgi:glycosyltransferase involved in cell wall biosynthesis
LLHRERFFSIYNGIELNQSWNNARDAQRFRRKYEIPAHKSIVAQLSWMIPEKGILDLLEAARLVVGRDPNAHFVLAGDGAYREQFIERSIAVGLRDNITWTGNLLDPRGEGVYAAADVVCQMSRWEEVFGFVIAEAMAAGKPVVATRAGGIPELVEDGRTGYLVERGDHEAMAGKILALLGDPSLRQQMGEAGRLAAETQFDLTANVARLLERYGIAGRQATASAGTVRLGAGASLAKSSTGTPVA